MEKFKVEHPELDYLEMQLKVYKQLGKIKKSDWKEMGNAFEKMSTFLGLDPTAGIEAVFTKFEEQLQSQLEYALSPITELVATTLGELMPIIEPIFEGINLLIKGYMDTYSTLWDEAFGRIDHYMRRLEEMGQRARALEGMEDIMATARYREETEARRLYLERQWLYEEGRREHRYTSEWI